MISKPSKDKLLTWSQFPISDIKKGVNYSSAVLMGDYLVVIAHDRSSREGSQDSDYDCDGDEPASLLAINLRDNSVQTEPIEDFYYLEDYSFTKYKENQIISFGGRVGRSFLEGVRLITIPSFEDFAFEVEELGGSEDGPMLRCHTAQIYNDCLYVYGGRDENFFQGPEADLWCFDIIKQTWTKCKTFGEGPGPRDRASSFIVQDNLYIYGGEGKSEDNGLGLKDIFVLNLSSMKWTKLVQEETYLQERNIYQGTDLNSDLYKGNLIVVGDGKRSDVLCCWNIGTNAWSKFNIEKNESLHRTGNFIVYKDLLLSCAATSNGLGLNILNLEKTGLQTSESPEEKRLRSLFMNEEGSDISFKVEDKIIPAHKDVLIQKSPYFANVFKSGMIESRQQVIDIQDCEYPVFQEFLRFIYLNKVELDADLALKLLALSDKYLQSDLNEKCMSFLTYNLSSDNIYKILEFAREEDMSLLKDWCMKYFRNNMNRTNVSGLIKFLEQEQKSEFAIDNLELKNKAFDIVIKDYVKICLEQKDDVPFYEAFLIKNVNQDTILRFAKLISPEEIQKSSLNSESPQDEAISDEWIINLRTVVMNFVKENFEMLKAQRITAELPNAFFVDFSSYLIAALPNGDQEDNMEIEDEDENEKSAEREENEAQVKTRRGRKRKEPVQDESLKETAVLKKTKDPLPLK